MDRTYNELRPNVTQYRTDSNPERHSSNYNTGLTRDLILCVKQSPNYIIHDPLSL